MVSSPEGTAWSVARTTQHLTGTCCVNLRPNCPSTHSLRPLQGGTGRAGRKAPTIKDRPLVESLQAQRCHSPCQARGKPWAQTKVEQEDSTRPVPSSHRRPVGPTQLCQEARTQEGAEGRFLCQGRTPDPVCPDGGPGSRLCAPRTLTIFVKLG